MYLYIYNNKYIIDIYKLIIYKKNVIQFILVWVRYYLVGYVYFFNGLLLDYFDNIDLISIFYSIEGS